MESNRFFTSPLNRALKWARAWGAAIAVITLLCTSATIADVKILGHEVREEKPEARSGFSFHTLRENSAYSGMLSDRKGAMISVGTFRPLELSSYGEFDQTIVLGSAADASEFNRLHFQLIAESKDRFDYLARLSQVNPSPALMDDARSGRISLEEFGERLWGARDFQSAEDPIVRKMRDALDGDLSGARGASGKRRGPRQSRYLVTLQKIKSGVMEEGGFSYLRDDKAFQALQSRIRKGKISAVVGDLSGKKTIEDLAQALKKERVPVSVLDLGTAIDDFVEGSETGEIAKEFDRFKKNLRELKFAPDAKIIFSLDSWNFDTVLNGSRISVSMDRESFESALKAGVFESADAFKKYFGSLIEKSVSPRVPFLEIGKGPAQVPKPVTSKSLGVVEERLRSAKTAREFLDLLDLDRNDPSGRHYKWINDVLLQHSNRFLELNPHPVDWQKLKMAPFWEYKGTDKAGLGFVLDEAVSKVDTLKAAHLILDLPESESGRRSLVVSDVWEKQLGRLFKSEWELDHSLAPQKVISVGRRLTWEGRMKLLNEYLKLGNPRQILKVLEELFEDVPEWIQPQFKERLAAFQASLRYRFSMDLELALIEAIGNSGTVSPQMKCGLSYFFETNRL